MKRGPWILLVASIALNVGFVSAAIVHWSDMHRAPAPPAMPAVGPGPLHRFGQPPTGLMRHWPNRRVDRLSEALDLTPEQEAKLRASLAELRDAIRARTEALMRERMVLREALLDEDRELVHRQARAVNVLQAELDSLVAEAMLREGAIFTPEQRRRIHEMEWGPGTEGQGRLDERR